jgi:hypothetical protein
MLHSLDAEVGKLASTVRRGFKWADLQMDDHLILCVCTPKEHVPEGLPADFDAKHDEQGRGLVKQLWFGYFSDIPARFLQYEHEERSRTYDGLFESMQYAYGQDFNENSPVTVVVYKRVR